MFGLISGFIDWYFTKPSAKILILGVENSGKTTLFEQIKVLPSKRPASGDLLGRLRPTVGLNMCKILLLGREITVWDLGGRSSLRVND